MTARSDAVFLMVHVMVTLKKGKRNEKVVLYASFFLIVCCLFLSGASKVYSVSARGWWPYFILKHL